MAKYGDLSITDATFIADVDLTTKQYFAVTVASTTGYVKTSTGTSNPQPIGILQNSPSAGQEAKVRIVGPSKAVGVSAGGSIVYGKWMVSASDGRLQAVATESGSPVLARWWDATVTASAYGMVYLPGLTTCHVSAS